MEAALAVKSHDVVQQQELNKCTIAASNPWRLTMRAKSFMPYASTRNVVEKGHLGLTFHP